jgi:hypothetical protein
VGVMWTAVPWVQIIDKDRWRFVGESVATGPGGEDLTSEEEYREE